MNNMNEKIVNLFDCFADKDSVKVLVSLAKENKTFVGLLNDTKLKEDLLKDKLVVLMDKNLVRYNDKKEVFSPYDAHVNIIINEVINKAATEIYRERTF